MSKMRVHNKRTELKVMQKPLKSLAELIQRESLEPCLQLAAGEHVLHLVRNQAGTDTDQFRATLVQVQVVEISEQPKVILPNNTTKRVRANSLFRRKAA